MTSRARQAAREEEIADYVRALRQHNGGGIGAPEAARFSHRDNRDYREAEVSLVMTDMGRGLR